MVWEGVVVDRIYCCEGAKGNQTTGFAIILPPISINRLINQSISQSINQFPTGSSMCQVNNITFLENVTLPLASFTAKETSQKDLALLATRILPTYLPTLP